ncbi:Inosine-uridine nucleoside N-ribohydrolase [Pseudozobellia thermophila]|uniref:Inosine-uridine nucleoside N-ribohydrolase n=2 Tax=Pseudozobellia thermophila TaxID=192903 RepID=A0A1M6EDC3_9FLAO|nr:Inosine-uridine nucleoside N-ribohydrolase [Pseudozobellia thermophila]
MLKKIRRGLLPFMVLAALNACKSQPKPDTERIPLIIDADTANEVDDLFALVRAVNEPKFDLLAITSAQFHTSPYASDSTVAESQEINEHLMALLGRTDIPLPLGSNAPLEASDAPQDSEAARFIVKKAHELEEGRKLQLVILGSCTNVASAILTDSTIVPKMQVNYLGFWHDPVSNRYNKKEFNSGNDSIAVNVLLNRPGLDIRVMTATTSQHLVFHKTRVDAHLKGKGGMADYLVDRWESYERWWTQKDPEKTKWTMWDVALIEALVHPEWTRQKTFETPKENTQRHIQIYTHIDVDQMEKDFWAHINQFVD